MSDTQAALSPRPTRNFANFTQWLKKNHFATPEEFQEWATLKDGQDEASFKESQDYIALKEKYITAAKKLDDDIKAWDERHPEKAKAIHREQLSKKRSIKMKRDKKNIRNFRGLPTFVVKELNKFTGLCDEAYDDVANELTEARKRVRILEADLADALEKQWDKAVSRD